MHAALPPASLFLPLQAATYFSGKPSSIYDADTLTVAAKKIRLHGLDAPELKQTCLDAAGAVYACGARLERCLAWIGAAGPVNPNAWHNLAVTVAALLL